MKTTGDGSRRREPSPVDNRQISLFGFGYFFVFSPEIQEIL